MSNSLRHHGLYPCQALLSMGFSRQAYWNRVPFPPPGMFPAQGSNPRLPHLPHLHEDFLLLTHWGKNIVIVECIDPPNPPPHPCDDPFLLWRGRGGIFADAWYTDVFSLGHLCIWNALTAQPNTEAICMNTGMDHSSQWRHCVGVGKICN